MATQNYKLTAQVEGYLIGIKDWSGADIHTYWNVYNEDMLQRAVWGISSDGWLQYQSAFNVYSIRYNAPDLILEENEFETEMRPSGTLGVECGVAFKFKDAFNYYYMVMNGGYADWGGRNIRLMKRVGSQKVLLADVNHPVFNPNTTYHIRVITNQGNIKIWLNGSLIFDFTDPNPISNGAFGPIVKGQEFAKWRFFSATSVTSFILMKQTDTLPIDHSYYDAAHSYLLFPETIQEFMQPVINDYLADKTYDDVHLTRFTITTTSSKVVAIFDQQDGVNSTADGNAHVYVYQVVPSSPPVAPTNFMGVALSESEIKYTWNHIDDSEDGFYIIDEMGTILATVGENTFTYTEQNLEPGTTYKRWVVAFNSAGNSPISNPVVVTTLPKLPDTPTNFSGFAINGTQIAWSWDPSDGASEYEIVTFHPDGTLSILATVPHQDISRLEWIEKDLLPSTDYTRAVRARNIRGHSGISNTATVTTKEELPNPPSLKPLNFMGVGISYDKILWTWEDQNTDLNGFYIYDEYDKIIATLSKEKRFWIEEDLYSAMEYRRRIAAYNIGGEGPKTNFAVAKTLPYGTDQEGTPLEPFNLIVENITETSAMLRWEYNDHHLLKGVGFKIYNHLDIVVEMVPIAARGKLIENLTPDTPYRFYVVAYNEVGDSLPSNVVEFITLKPQAPEEEPEPSLPSDFVDPYYGLEYDVETIDTPKIQAFHSGVGDGLDLIVKNLQEGYYEVFQYEMYIKGHYLEEELYYPVIPFRFKMTVDAHHDDGTPYHNETEWIEGVVQGADDGIGTQYSSSINLPPLPDDVFVTKSNFKVQLYDKDGNLIPMYDGSTNHKVNWVLESNIREELIGSVNEIKMDNVFYNWQKFSHSGNKQPGLENELHTWIYDEENDEIQTTVNSSTFMGAVSPDRYDIYETTMTLRSHASDNDFMGFVLAFATDENGWEHTLTAVRMQTTQNMAGNALVGYDWAICYNFNQTNTKVLAKMRIDEQFQNWHRYYPNGTVIKAKRNLNLFQVWTSKAGSDEILPESLLTVDLDSDPVLEIFKGPKQIGVGALSQQYASLKIIDFHGRKTKVFFEHFLTAWTNETATRLVKKEWIGARSYSDPIRIQALEEKILDGQIQSPKYQIPWQEIAKDHSFTDYQLVLTTTNPNVWIEPVTKIQNFFPDHSTFINFKIKAKIINHTQTNWHPSIHTGYYYLNQREYFLFADDNVQPKRDDYISLYMYKFPYVIRAIAEREVPAHTKVIEESASFEFLRGAISSGVEIFPIEKRMTLKEQVSFGTYTSSILDFGDTVDHWQEPVIEQDLDAIQKGAVVKLEVAPIDEEGKTGEWTTMDRLRPTRRIRYKLSMAEKLYERPYEFPTNFSIDMLQEGYQQHIHIEEDGTITMSEPAIYHMGTYITPAIELGTQITNMGKVEIIAENPLLIDAYSVSTDSDTHDFTTPTSNEPWIPLRKVAQNGNKITFVVDSAPKRYLAFVFQLKADITKEPMVVPSISSIQAIPVLYELNRVVPTVHSIKIIGDIPTRYYTEEFLVPKMGSVIADQIEHEITKETAEQIVLDYCASIGVPHLNELVFKDYKAEADTAYYVELRTHLQGKMPIYAKTTAEIGDIVKQQEKFYFDKDTRDIILQPIPQAGSPIIVKNAANVLLRQVHFRDDNGYPTLTNVEEFETDGTQFLFLQYREHEIDRETFRVYIDLEKKGNWKQIFNCELNHHRLILPELYPAYTPIRVQYQLKDSFYVDYNYDVSNDHVRIKVNTAFAPDIKETRFLDVRYETKKKDAYYLAEEVDLNPLHTKIHSGFIYLTDEYYPPYKLHLVCNPNKIYRTKKEKLLIHAYVYDIYENPVVGERISWETTYGRIEILSHVTDANGMAMAYYIPPEDPMKHEAIIRTNVVGRSKETHLSKELTIELVDETFVNQLCIIPEKYIVQSGDIVSIKVIAMGPNEERIPSAEIRFKTNSGVIAPISGITDYKGELIVQYRDTGDEEPHIIIEASNAPIKEQILLGRSGV